MIFIQVHFKFKMNLNIVLDQGARCPTRAHETDAGYDLYSNEEVLIGTLEKALVSTGVKMTIPNGYFGKIFSRSGLAVKSDLEVGAGVIDSGYRGEVKVLLRNHSNTHQIIKRGEKIAQIVFLPYMAFNIVQVDNLDKSDRGEAGFGSTG